MMMHSKNLYLQVQKALPNNQQVFQVMLLDKNYQVQAINILNHSFYTENPVWKHYAIDQNATIEYVAKVVKQSIKNKMLHGVVGKEKQQIRSVIVYLDMVDYQQLRKISMEKYANLKLINQFGSHSQKLEETIKFMECQRGTVSRGFMLATYSDHLKKKYSILLITIALTDLRDRGYKISYGRSSNQVSKIILQNLGGRVINTVNIQGIKQPFYLMQNTHENFQVNNDIRKIWSEVGFMPKLGKKNVAILIQLIQIFKLVQFILFSVLKIHICVQQCFALIQYLQCS